MKFLKDIKKIKILSNKKKGFSMGEVLLAAFVISVALVTIGKLLSVGITTSADVRNSIIASQLTKEGAELVRNMRDSNWAEGLSSFECGLDFPNNNSSNCVIDKDNNLNCGVTEDIFKLYSSNGFYVHNNTGNDTGYLRNIIIEYDGDDCSTSDYATVYSVVSWGGDLVSPSDCSLANKCFYTKSILTKWGDGA